MPERKDKDENKDKEKVKVVEIKLRLTNQFVGLLKVQMNLGNECKINPIEQTPKDVLATTVLGEAMGSLINETYERVGEEWQGMVTIVEDGRQVLLVEKESCGHKCCNHNCEALKHAGEQVGR